MRSLIGSVAFAFALMMNFPANAQHHAGGHSSMGHSAHNFPNHYAGMNGVGYGPSPYLGYGRLTPRVSVYYGNSLPYYGGFSNSYGIYGNGGYGFLGCNPYASPACTQRFFLLYGYYPY